jgi:hypothetical protein
MFSRTSGKRRRDSVSADTANTLRRIVGTITDETVAARLERLAAGYKRREDAYAISNNERRRATHADGDEEL